MDWTGKTHPDSAEKIKLVCVTANAVVLECLKQTCATASSFPNGDIFTE